MKLGSWACKPATGRLSVFQEGQQGKLSTCLKTRIHQHATGGNSVLQGPDGIKLLLRNPTSNLLSRRRLERVWTLQLLALPGPATDE